MPVIRDRERGLILLSRLEAATSLLESIVAPNLGDASAPTIGTAPNDEGGLAPGGRMDQARGMTASPQPIEPLPPAIEDFDTIIDEDVQAFVNMSEEIGGLVAEQVRLPRCRKHMEFCADLSSTSQLPYSERLRQNEDSFWSLLKQRSQINSPKYTWRY